MVSVYHGMISLLPRCPPTSHSFKTPNPLLPSVPNLFWVPKLDARGPLNQPPFDIDFHLFGFRPLPFHSGGWNARESRVVPICDRVVIQRYPSSADPGLDPHSDVW